MDKQRACLVTGLAGALLGTAGELLGGFSPAGDFTSPVTILFSSLKSLPMWRIGLCSTLGGLGILLQFFGYYAICLSFEDRENFRGRLCTAANWGFTIVGAICHILCCVFIFLYCLTLSIPGRMDVLENFLIWFFLPFAAVFLISYITFCVLFSLQICGGHSSFPRWCGYLNPLGFMIFFPILAGVLPSSAAVNGLYFANMGLTSILIFTVLLIADNR